VVVKEQKVTKNTINSIKESLLTIKAAFLVSGLIFPLILGGILVVSTASERLHLAWSDFLYEFRGVRNPPQDIVIVAIDEPSMREIGRRWPWPRSMHAQLVSELKQAGAQTIFFDVLFVEPSAEPTTDQRFADAIAAAGNVILASALSQTQRRNFVQTQLLTPLPVLAKAAQQLALINYLPDRDGVIRRGHRLIDGHPTVAEVIGGIPTKHDQMLSEAENRFLIDFSGPHGNVAAVSYYQALNRDKYLPPDFFRDKIVLVGFVSDQLIDVQGAIDSFPTPFFRISKKPMVGVEIHANAIATLLNGRPLREGNMPWVWGIYLLLAWLLGLVRHRPLLLIASAISIIFGLMAMSITLFTDHGIVITVAPAMLIIAGTGIYWGVIGHLEILDQEKRVELDKIRIEEEMMEALQAQVGERRKLEEKAVENNRLLGLSYQSSGQLDLALEAFRKCPMDESLMELLYNLGIDFEKRQQLEKATTVYRYMAQYNQEYRDIKQRIARFANIEQITETMEALQAQVGERRKLEEKAVENNRLLGLSYQSSGQLDLALEAFRKCPMDESLMELLYNLGIDFEKRQQLEKATTVYRYMAQYNQEYRDIKQRIARFANIEPTIVMKSDQAETPLRLLGRYEVIKAIGKGAMGIVYQGIDPYINRMVAIKVLSLSDNFEDDTLTEAKARFFREAQSMGRLNHPNIVTIYDSGVEQDKAYIVMEFLEGNDLTAYTKPGKLLPVRIILPMIASVADALDYAHRHNVVHRDIKPHNIIYNPETDRVTLTDFGIARLTEEGQTKTKTGILVGTLAYTSPEQINGAKVDGRSDLFSLGATLYELLTGQRAFDGDPTAAMLHKITHLAPKNPLIIRPNLHQCIINIVDKALQKDPTLRYRTGSDMAQALRDCCSKIVNDESTV
jgi:CHASE2 domain-containing sensor protein/tRNA A-37 threonylcarbamoyl transferase component Bud32